MKQIIVIILCLGIISLIQHDLRRIKHRTPQNVYNKVVVPVAKRYSWHCRHDFASRVCQDVIDQVMRETAYQWFLLDGPSHKERSYHEQKR